MTDLQRLTALTLAMINDSINLRGENAIRCMKMVDDTIPVYLDFSKQVDDAKAKAEDIAIWLRGIGTDDTLDASWGDYFSELHATYQRVIDQAKLPAPYGDRIQEYVDGLAALAKNPSEHIVGGFADYQRVSTIADEVFWALVDDLGYDFK